MSTDDDQPEVQLKWATFIRPEAERAWLRLGSVLRTLEDVGRLVPCVTEPDAFTSPHHEIRAGAARLCLTCPALEDCRAFADLNRERAWVWAGRDRTPGSRPPPEFFDGGEVARTAPATESLPRESSSREPS